MPQPYSDDLRCKRLEAYAAGAGTLRVLAQQFRVSFGYSKKIRRQPLQTGQPERPPPSHHGPVSRLSADRRRQDQRQPLVPLSRPYSAQRGNVKLPNPQLLNALLYVAEHGCKWRGLPKRFGKWHTIYTRMNRWSKNGVLDQVFEQLPREQIVRIRIEAVSLDSTTVKVHPDGTGALKKTDRKPSASRAADGLPRFIWLPQMRERR